jgi:hypothetical protein
MWFVAAQQYIADQADAIEQQKAGLRLPLGLIYINAFLLHQL